MDHDEKGRWSLSPKKGFPASAMAKKNAGDWRDPEQIRTWADGIAETLTLSERSAP